MCIFTLQYLRITGSTVSSAICYWTPWTWCQVQQSFLITCSDYALLNVGPMRKIVRLLMFFVADWSYSHMSTSTCQVPASFWFWCNDQYQLPQLHYSLCNELGCLMSFPSLRSLRQSLTRPAAGEREFWKPYAQWSKLHATLYTIGVSSIQLRTSSTLSRGSGRVSSGCIIRRCSVISSSTQKWIYDMREQKYFSHNRGWYQWSTNLGGCSGCIPLGFYVGKKAKKWTSRWSTNFLVSYCSDIVSRTIPGAAYNLDLPHSRCKADALPLRHTPWAKASVALSYLDEVWKKMVQYSRHNCKERRDGD